MTKPYTEAPERLSRRLERLGMIHVEQKAHLGGDTTVVDFTIPYPWGEAPSRDIAGITDTRSTLKLSGDDDALAGGKWRLPQAGSIPDVSEGEATRKEVKRRVRRIIDSEGLGLINFVNVRGGRGPLQRTEVYTPHIELEINTDGHDYDEMVRTLDTLVEEYYDAFRGKFARAEGDG